MRTLIILSLLMSVSGTAWAGNCADFIKKGFSNDMRYNSEYHQCVADQQERIVKAVESIAEALKK